MNQRNTILTIKSLAVGYHLRHEQQILAQHLNLSLRTGELTCLLGPNGAGKSTFMRTLAGMHAPLHGSIHLHEKNLYHLKARELARKISVVLTDRVDAGNLTAYSVVAMGRYPYTGWFGYLGAKDTDIVQWAIQTTGIAHLTTRHLHHLSDGERQKVMIARALAQDTPVILLDEPTVHLDLPNRMSIVNLLRKLVKETGKSVLMTTHALDLALQCADKLWLMSKKNIQAGVPEDLILQGAVERIFQKEGMQFDLTSGTFRLQQPCQREVRLHGAGIACVWTRRALEREGFAVNNENFAAPGIEVFKKEEKNTWSLTSGDHTEAFQSLEELMEQLRSLPLQIQEVKNR